MLLGDATALLTCHQSVAGAMKFFTRTNSSYDLALGGLTQIFTADASHAKLLMVSWK